MQKINNLTPEVYLSTYDNSGKCYPVDAGYKGIENVSQIGAVRLLTNKLY